MSFDPDFDENVLEAVTLNRRLIPEEQLRKYEGYMAEILTAFGLDLETPATHKTPQRYIRARAHGAALHPRGRIGLPFESDR